MIMSAATSPSRAGSVPPLEPAAAGRHGVAFARVDAGTGLGLVMLSPVLSPEREVLRSGDLVLEIGRAVVCPSDLPAAGRHGVAFARVDAGTGLGLVMLSPVLSPEREVLRSGDLVL